MNQPLEQNIAGIETGIQNENKDTAVILFHGFGANRFDLEPLANVLDPKKEKTWYFPNGPLQLQLSPFFDARAWVHIDLAAFDKAMRENCFQEHLDKNPPQIDAIINQLKPFIEIICSKHKKVILGGFSQGSMVALDLVLLNQFDVSDVILFSCAFVAKNRWLNLMKTNTKPLRIFQSHGTLDPILPFENAKSLFESLKDHSHNIDFHDFAGGHEIPMSVLLKLHAWL